MPPTPWPFWPQWAAVYLSLDLLIPWSFWRVPQARLPFLAAGLLVSTLIAWPFFLLLPLAPIPQPAGGPGPWTFQLADLLNLSGNYFPSLHVAYALLCSAFLGSPGVWCWAALIAVSTLLTHQHYSIDVLGGAGLAWLSYRWVHHAGLVESLCLGEMARCASRHRRYALIALGLYAVSLAHPRRRRLARVGFCYLQHLDDLLDGHLTSPEEPEQLASRHQQALLGRQPFPQDPAGRLGPALLEELQGRRECGRSWVVELIEEMKLDRRRVREQLLLSEAELDAHLERTFELSLDLMLLAADSPLRSRQVPHLVKALGWCSVVRDYTEDQRLGLINVPGAIWGDSARLSAWFGRRHALVMGQLEQAELELSALRGQSGCRLLGLFHRSVGRYAHRAGADRQPGENKNA
jgi:hypothetical protein